MCTALTYKSKDFYFGRNYDYEKSYDVKIAALSENFMFGKNFLMRFPVIGAAHIASGTPLFFDGLNNFGLAAAALNFSGNAFYNNPKFDALNIAFHELIPYVLGNAKTVDKATELLQKINLTNALFSPEYSVSELHWIFADKNSAVTVEPLKDGLKIHENKIGVLTNNPPFDYQMFALNNFLSLSPNNPVSRFGTELDVYSRGMGAIGLPGDFSSQSRFVKAAFIKLNAKSPEGEEESVSQVFNMLSSVGQIRGAVKTENGFEYTIYSSCMNTDRGIYYAKNSDRLNFSRVSFADMPKGRGTLSVYTI